MRAPKAVLLAATLLAGTASIASAADPYGTWERPSTGTRVQFYDCGGKVCAKIVSVKDKSKQSTVGTVIMKGASKSGANQWNGELLNTEDGKIYAGKVSLEAGGLKLEGCALGGLVCKGEVWKKVN